MKGRIISNNEPVKIFVSSVVKLPKLINFPKLSSSVLTICLPICHCCKWETVAIVFTLLSLPETFTMISL